MEKYKDTFRIPSARLQNWDYGSPGLYFITICTQNREHYFGESIPSSDKLLPETSHHSSLVTEDRSIQTPPSFLYTQMGEIAHQYWSQIPHYSPFVELDAFVVMPNHLHGILFLNKPIYDQWQPNRFGPQSKNIPSVIRGFKAAVKKYATLNQISFGWQSRYYDRVIRSEQELHNIRQYIYDNPMKWEANQNNPENLLM